MAESGLSISYSDLLVEVGVYLGYDPTPDNWSTAQTAEVDRYIQAGVRQFYYPPAVEGVKSGHVWSFLNPTTSISTAEGDGEQDLPDDLGRVLGDFFFDDQEHRPSIVQVSEARIQALLQRSDDEGCPQVATIRHKAQTAGSGQRLEVVWWPIPDATYVLHYRYEAYNGKLSATNLYPLGGMRYSELVLESCLAIAEQRANDERGIHTENFIRLLRSGIAEDCKQGARYYGPMGGNNGVTVPRHGDTGANYNITYKETTW